MERLVVCDGCSRHVRAGERACPHCGAELAGRAKGRGAVGAAVVVTASLASACGSSGASDRNDVERGSGGEIIEPGDVVIDMRDDSPAVVADAGPPVAADAGPAVVEDMEHFEFERERPDMPYGAPRARGRLV